MYKHERLNLLIQLLRNAEVWQAAELADELNVSLRTLMRDIEALREQSYPIEAERGRGGGIRLLPNWAVKNIQLKDREVISLLLSLSISEKMNGPLFQSDLGIIKQKMMASLSPHQVRNVKELKNRIFIGDRASEHVMNNFQEKYFKKLELLQYAFVNCQKMEMNYISEKKEITTRVVEPHALYLNWPVWYLICHDELRDAQRAFRVDRIKSIKLVDNSFVSKAKQMFDEYLGTEFGSSI